MVSLACVLIPMYVQTGLGLSAGIIGVVILPGAVFNAFISVYTGKVFDRFGLRVLVIPGFIVDYYDDSSFLSTDTPF